MLIENKETMKWLQFIHTFWFWLKLSAINKKRRQQDERNQIIIECLDDSFSGNMFVYIFISRLIILSILWSKKTAGARKLEFRVPK